MEENDSEDIESLQEKIEANFITEGNLFSCPRSDKQDETLLPVHFMPEGKRCYDWIAEDLKRVETKDSLALPSTNEISTEDSGNVKRNSLNLEICACHIPSVSGFLTTLSELCEICFQEELTLKDDLQNVVSADVCLKCRKNILDVNVMGSMLLQSAEYGQQLIVHHILSQFSDLVLFKDEDGYTALHRASYNGHLGTVSSLIKTYSADLSSKTCDGWEPLHCACRWNQLDVAEFLLDQGANINSQTNGGVSPLHLVATSQDRVELLEMLLLQRDIKTDLFNNAGESAYSLAIKNGVHYKLFELVNPSLNSF